MCIAKVPSEIKPRMKVTLTKTDTRALVPITLQISDTKENPEVKIIPLDKNSAIEPYLIDVHPTEKGATAEFWFQNKGTYTLEVKTSSEVITKTITIQDQFFLPFSIEFGVGFGLLCITLFGIFLWIKIKKRYART